MSKVGSRKVKIVKESIAGFLFNDADIFLQTKFSGDLEKKEKAEETKLRSKAMKEFADDVIEVYGFDSEKIQEIGAELIVELAAAMNSSLSDLVKLLEVENQTSASSKKRKAAIGDATRAAKIGGKKTK